MIRIFIADDHISVLDAFRNFISAEEDMTFVGCATSGVDALAQCRMLNPDVVLTDTSMENSDSGIRLAVQIKEEMPNTRVIVMSGFDEISYIPEAKKAGADAFLSKSTPLSEFVHMIRAVLRGEGSFPKEVQIPTAQGETPFTERELEIMRLLCHSYSRKEIAETIHVAEGTVKRHLENMLLKSGCKSSLELVVYVVGNGWISPR